MLYYVVKITISAALIVAISEIAKKSSLVGAIVASLPVISILAFVWLYIDTRDVAQISTLSKQIFWLVIPSLILFISLPLLLKHHVNFYLSLLISIGLTATGYLVLLWLLKFKNIHI